MNSKVTRYVTIDSLILWSYGNHKFKYLTIFIYLVETNYETKKLGPVKKFLLPQTMKIQTLKPQFIVLQHIQW